VARQLGAGARRVGVVEQLELNLTNETLQFNHYWQPDSQPALHIEPGIWIHIPPTTAPKEPETVSRLATISHGDAVCAVGGTAQVAGKPKIDPVNTVPFPIGSPAPAPGEQTGSPSTTGPHRPSSPVHTKPVPDCPKTCWRA
jgi:hypothetical protein